jgi:hypothetical protein
VAQWYSSSYGGAVERGTPASFQAVQPPTNATLPGGSYYAAPQAYQMPSPRQPSQTYYLPARTQPASHYAWASDQPAHPQADPSHEPEIVASPAPLDFSKLDEIGKMGADKGCATACNSPACAQWMATAELMWLTRTRPNSFPLIREVPLGHPDPLTHTTVVFDTSDFDFGGAFGYRVGLSRMVNCCWGVEVNFMGLAESWEDEQEFTGLYEMNGYNFAFGVDPDFHEPLTFCVRDESDFLTTDVNLLHGLCDWATVRAGVRWARFDENLKVHELLTPIYDALCVSTENQMIGPQAGVDFKLLELWCRFRINATMNFGMLYNQITYDCSSNLVGPALHAEAHDVALLGEFGLNAKYRLTDHCALRGGFYMLSLKNIALAPDQIIASDVVTEVATLRTGGLVGYGGTFGLEVFW